MLETRDIRLDSGNALCFVSWECWPGVSKTVRPHTETSLKGFFPYPHGLERTGQIKTIDRIEPLRTYNQRVTRTLAYFGDWGRDKSESPEAWLELTASCPTTVLQIEYCPDSTRGHKAPKRGIRESYSFNSPFLP